MQGQRYKYGGSCVCQVMGGSAKEVDSANVSEGSLILGDGVEEEEGEEEEEEGAGMATRAKGASDKETQKDEGTEENEKKKEICRMWGRYL